MEHKKKIIFVITKSVWGGAGRYVFDLAVSLHKEGHDVKVAMGGNGLLASRLIEENIPVIEIPNLTRDFSLSRELRVFTFLYNFFKKEKPDIIHLNSSKAGLGAVAGRMNGIKKIVFTLHGLAINENRPRWQKILMKYIYHLTVRLCHTTIAVSKAVADQLTKEAPSIKRKIVLIHNGISIEHLYTKTEAKEKLVSLIREQTKIPDLHIASLFIGNVAELHPIKGQTFLIEGFRDALDRSALPLYLFIMGEGEERLRLEELIKEYRLERHVFLCGHIKNVMQYLKAFDIFILSSLSEALPYAVAEAGFVGLPVIASNVGGVPEIISDKSQGILIRPRAVNEITDSILTLAYEPHLRRELGSNLHKRITSEFTIEKMIAETKKIYALE